MGAAAPQHQPVNQNLSLRSHFSYGRIFALHYGFEACIIAP